MHILDLIRTSVDNNERNRLAIQIADERIEGGAEILIHLLRDPALHDRCGSLLYALAEMDARVPIAVLGAIIDNPESSWEAKVKAWGFIDDYRDEAEDELSIGDRPTDDDDAVYMGNGSYVVEDIPYADMTPEQRRIVDGGDEIAGNFPRGLTHEELAAWLTNLCNLAELTAIEREGMMGIMTTGLAHGRSTDVIAATIAYGSTHAIEVGETGLNVRKLTHEELAGRCGSMIEAALRQHLGEQGIVGHEQERQVDETLNGPYLIHLSTKGNRGYEVAGAASAAAAAGEASSAGVTVVTTD